MNGLKKGDRVRLSPEGQEWLSADERQRGRLGTIVTTPQQPSVKVCVFWDGQKGASYFASRFIEKVGEKTS